MDVEERDTDQDTVRHRLHAIGSAMMTDIIEGRGQDRQVMEETDTELPAHDASSLRTISHSHAVTRRTCRMFRSSPLISLIETF